MSAPPYVDSLQEVQVCIQSIDSKYAFENQSEMNYNNSF
jgi:hypothetical protein